MLSFLRKPKAETASAIERALAYRVGHPSPMVQRGRGTLLVDVRGGDAYTITLAKGTASWSRGRASRPTSIVRADEPVLRGILEGKVSGLEAFLDGRLEVRGNVGLALKLDLFFPPATPLPIAPRPGLVEVSGLETFYMEAGKKDAPPVILLHGLGATNVSILPPFLPLAKHYRVIAPDLPGFGETGKPLLAPYNFAFFARWLVGLFDALGIDRAHVVGNSMGGRIALELAMRAPERASKLVLLAPSMAWRSYRELAPLVRLLRPEMAFLPIPLVRTQAVLVLRSLFANPARVPASWLDAAADEFTHVLSSARGRISFLAAARSIYLEDPHGERGFWDRLSTIRSPALFVWGDRDWLVPKKFSRHAAAALPHSEAVVLADCGHVPQYDLPERTLGLVERFFAGSPPPSATEGGTAERLN